MMRPENIITLIIMIIGSLLSAWYGPWWAPSLIIILMAALLKLSAKQAMLSGAFTLGLIFLGMALLSYSADEADIISKIGAMLGGLSVMLMLLITTLTGIITGLLSGWTGSAIGAYIKKI